jgi:hypothetical protein
VPHHCVADPEFRAGKVTDVSGDPTSLRQAQLAICADLLGHRARIERELLNRIKAVANTDDITDPEYSEGLRRAVSSGFDYALTGVESSERHLPPIPISLLAQARLAARNGLSIDLVILRCSTCFTIIRNYIAIAFENIEVASQVKLSDVLRVQGIVFDRLTKALTEEHRREREQLASDKQKRFSATQSLLDGEWRDGSMLGCDLDAFHIAAIAKGVEAADTVRTLASTLDCRYFAVSNADGAIWAWMSRRHKPNITKLEEVISGRWPPKIYLAIGEIAYGEEGWRLSHQQARAAFLLALRRPGCVIRYAADPLLVTAIRDDLLTACLKDFFLAPLKLERDGGVVLRQTLRAYFAADRNGASAAAALRVTRQTVTNRLKVIERRVGRPISTCAAEFETALRLEELRNSPEGMA